MNKQYRQQFILPYFQSQPCKDQTLELKIFGFMGLVESQLLLRSLNKFALQTSKFISPFFFDDQNKKHHKLRGLSKYQITYIEQIRALRDSLVTKKRVDLQLSVYLKVVLEDIQSKYMELDTLVQLLNQMAYLHHLVLDGSNVESFETICEGFEELNMTTYHNSLRSLTYQNFKFNDQKSSLILSKMIDVQCQLRVIQFERCQLNSDSIQVLINYLGSGYGGQSLVEIAFVAIEFDWKEPDQKKPRNQQQELALALLQQSTLTSLTIKHTSDMKDFIYEILTHSGVQSEQLKEQREELEQIYSDTEFENEELFDNLLSDKKSDGEGEGNALETEDAFEANFGKRKESSIKSQEHKEEIIVKTEVEQEEDQNWETEDQFNFDDAMTKTRGEAFTIRGDKNKPNNIIPNEEVKPHVIEEVTVIEDDDQGFGFNFDQDAIRTRGEAFTIKSVKTKNESENNHEHSSSDAQTLPNTEDKQHEDKQHEDKQVEVIVKEVIIHQEIKSEHQQHEDLDNNSEQEYIPRARGQAMTFSKAKNKEELEKIQKAIQEQSEEQNNDEEDFDIFEDRLIGRTRGEAITIKAVKTTVEEVQVVEIKQEEHIAEVKQEEIIQEIKIDAPIIIEDKEVIVIEEKIIPIQQEIVSKELHEDLSEDFNEDQFQPRARGQAMTFSKSKNKEELEKIQQAIEEQKKLEENEFKEEEEGFGFNEDAFMTRSRGQAFTIKEVNKNNERDEISHEINIEDQIIIEKEVQKTELIQTIVAEVHQDVVVEVIPNQEHIQDNILIEQESQKVIHDDEFNDNAFQPRARGEAMTISKSKNKEVLEEIQKGIQEQHELDDDEDDQFSYFDQALAGRTRGEAFTIKGKEKVEEEQQQVDLSITSTNLENQSKVIGIIAVVKTQQDFENNFQDQKSKPIEKTLTLDRVIEDKGFDVSASSQGNTKMIDMKLGGKGLNLAEESVLISTPIITSALNIGTKQGPINNNESPTKSALPLARSRRTMTNIKKPATKVEIEKTEVIIEQSEVIKKEDEIQVIQQMNSTKNSTQPKALVLDKVDHEEFTNDMGFNFDQLARTRAPATTMGKGKKVQFNMETDVKVIPNQTNTIIDTISEQEEITNQENKSASYSPNKSKGLERSRRTLMAQKKPATKVQQSVPTSNTTQLTSSIKDAQTDKLKIDIDENDGDEDDFGFNFDAMTRARGEAMTIKGQKKGEGINEIQNTQEEKDLSVVIDVKAEQSVSNDQLGKTPSKTPVVRSRRTITMTKKAETKTDNLTTTDPNLKQTSKVELKIDSETKTMQRAPLLGKTPLSMSKNTLLGDNKQASIGFDFGELAKPKGEPVAFNKPTTQFQMKPAIGINNITKPVSTEVKVVVEVENNKVEEVKQSNDSTSPSKGRLERSRRTIAPVKKPATKVVQINSNQTVDSSKIENQQVDQITKERQPLNLKQEDDDGYGINFDQMTRSRGAAMTISKGSAQAQQIQEMVKQEEIIQVQQEQQVKVIETITIPKQLGILTDDIKLNETKQQVVTPSKGRLERSRRTILPVKKPVTKVLEQNNTQPEGISKIESQQVEELNKDNQAKNLNQEDEDGFGFNFDQMTRSRGAALTISKGSSQAQQIQDSVKLEEKIQVQQEENKEQVVEKIVDISLTKQIEITISDDIKLDEIKQQVVTPSKGRLERS